MDEFNDDQEQNSKIKMLLVVVSIVLVFDDLWLQACCRRQASSRDFVADVHRAQLEGPCVHV